MFKIISRGFPQASRSKVAAVGQAKVSALTTAFNKLRNISVLKQSPGSENAGSPLRVRATLPSGEWVTVELEGDNEAETVVMRVGLSESQLDAVGDIHTVEVVAGQGTTQLAGCPLLNLHWEGFLISAADELYHTKWSNAAGVFSIVLPFPVRVLGYNVDVLNAPANKLTSEEDAWLVRVELSKVARKALMLDDDSQQYLSAQARATSSTHSSVPSSSYLRSPNRETRGSETDVRQFSTPSTQTRHLSSSSFSQPVHSSFPPVHQSMDSPPVAPPDRYASQVQAAQPRRVVLRTRSAARHSFDMSPSVSCSSLSSLQPRSEKTQRNSAAASGLSSPLRFPSINLSLTH